MLTLQLMEPIVLSRRISVAGDTHRSHSKLTIMILYMRLEHLSLEYTNRSSDVSVDSVDGQYLAIASTGASLGDVVDLSKSVPKFPVNSQAFIQRVSIHQPKDHISENP